MADIVVGASLPKTGTFAGDNPTYRQYSSAYGMWVRDINAAGGLLGREVRLLTYDDGSEPDGVIANYTRLINEDRVDLILGPCHSALIEPAAPVAEKAHMVMIEGSGSVSEMFRKGRRFLFLSWGPDCDYPESYLKFMTSRTNPKPITKVANVYGDSQLAPGHVFGVHKHADALGLEITFEEQTAEGADYGDLFHRARATGAEGVVWNMSTDLRGRDARQKAIQAALGAGFVTSQLWLSANPSDWEMDGVFTRNTWTPNIPTAKSKKFTHDFTEFAGFVPEYHSSGGYGCGEILAQAVTAAGSLDQEAIREQMLSIEFDTVLGKLRFGEDGLPITIWPLAQWQNGIAELVYPEGVKTKDAVFE